MKAIYSLLILISYTLSTESFRSVVYSFGFSSYTSQIGSLNIRERYSQQSRVDLINDNQKYKRSDPSMFSGGSLYSAIEPIAKQQNFPLPKFTPSEINDLKMGKLLEKQQRIGRGGYASVVMDLPASSEAVFATLSNIRSYDRLIKTVKSVKIYKSDTTNTRICGEFCLSKFLLKINVVHTIDAAQKLIKFSLDPNRANPVIQFVDGFWFLEDLSPSDFEEGPRTRLWFNVRLEVNKIVPSFIVDYAACRALPRATRWIQPYFASKAEL